MSVITLSYQLHGCNLQNISGNIRDDISPPRQQPEVISVTFGKVNGSMGLSIVAAKVSETKVIVGIKIDRVRIGA